jgi:hypothetical protein
MSLSLRELVSTRIALTRKLAAVAPGQHISGSSSLSLRNVLSPA